MAVREAGRRPPQKIRKAGVRTSFLNLGTWIFEGRPGAMLNRGNSVVGTICDEIRRRIRPTNQEPERLTKCASESRQLNASRYGYVIKEYWDGEAVRASKNGDIRIFVSADRPALLRRLGMAFFKLGPYDDSAVIQF